ncbi:MAG: stage III sporulation protein AD [Bacilli bacterium]
MDILQIVGISLVATVLIVLLKEFKSPFIIYISLFTIIAIFLTTFDAVIDLLTMIRTLAEKANINFFYIETILKIIGIAYIAEFGAAIVKDAGQGALATKIEFAGKIFILVLAIPILTVVIETILRLIPIG